jgi:hypothetical protein
MKQHLQYRILEYIIISHCGICIRVGQYSLVKQNKKLKNKVLACHKDGFSPNYEVYYVI